MTTNHTRTPYRIPTGTMERDALTARVAELEVALRKIASERWTLGESCAIARAALAKGQA